MAKTTAQQREYNRRYLEKMRRERPEQYEELKQRRRVAEARRREANPALHEERMQKAREQQREWRARRRALGLPTSGKSGKSGKRVTPEDPVKVREGRRRRRYVKRYGLTVEQFEAMSAAQNHLCSICNRPEPRGRLCVDHDHETNVVRGLLCHACNCGLGYLGDSIEGLQRALDYLTQVARVSQSARV